MWLEKLFLLNNLSHFNRSIIHNLMPAPVPGGMVAVAMIYMRSVPVHGRSSNDYRTGAVTVVVANTVVGDVAACYGDCDYCEYDCRY